MVLIHAGVVQGVKGDLPQLQAGMQPYGEQIMRFLQVIDSDEDCPIEVIKAATGVLGCDTHRHTQTRTPSTDHTDTQTDGS